MVEGLNSPGVASAGRAGELVPVSVQALYVGVAGFQGLGFRV